jgi:hypothetical protein
VKIVNCLDIEYLLSLPCNFRGYKKGNFSDQAHSRHLWYRNAARIVGWRNVRHEFPSAISSFIKQEVWPEQEINGATKIAEVGTDAGIPKALGRGNGWNGALVSRRETICMDPPPAKTRLRNVGEDPPELQQCDNPKPHGLGQSPARVMNVRRKGT